MPSLRPRTSGGSALRTSAGVMPGLMAGYAMGTPARMGPAFFPFWLGMILALLGIVSLSCGLILDTVTRGRREVKRLAYLALKPPGA